MRLGIHVSISGGMAQMARTAVEVGCETVQIFSRSPRGGKAKELCPTDVAAMKAILKDNHIYPLVVHVPYFVNLASKDLSKREYSIETLREDLERAEILGASFVVTHPGHREKDEDQDSPAVLARVYLSIEKVLNAYKGPVRLLLENTAGQGREIGSRVESIGTLLKSLPQDRTGACLDTCHAFGAGYDVSSEDRVFQFLTAFDKYVGLERLFAIHLNDSRGDLGSRVDRHAHIGQGKIGDRGIQAVILSALLPEQIPGILETPSDTPSADRDNVSRVKGLRTRGK